MFYSNSDTKKITSISFDYVTYHAKSFGEGFVCFTLTKIKFIFLCKYSNDFSNRSLEDFGVIYQNHKMMQMSLLIHCRSHPLVLLVELQFEDIILILLNNLKHNKIL